jgi:hypothetical protein
VAGCGALSDRTGFVSYFRGKKVSDPDDDVKNFSPPKEKNGVKIL